MSNLTASISPTLEGNDDDIAAAVAFENGVNADDFSDAPGSEESDTDASTDSTEINVGEVEHDSNGDIRSQDKDNRRSRDVKSPDVHPQVCDYESQITFLKLKLKLLVKESNIEYNEVRWNVAHQ